MSAAAKPSRNTNRAVVTTPSEREIRIERTFDAPRERVWRAMTEEALLKQWWGRGHALDVERFELRVGGHWRFVEHEGGRSHGFEGRFREITPPSRLSMTFEWDGAPGHTMVQTQTLEALDGGRTKIVTLSLFFTQEDRDGMLSSGMEGGMNESLAALDTVLASL
ncbi:MAG TPA: SRPBCC family protein [Polyangia bacterium]|nr:SRPBCC family protein [Polyangia bacterium]